MGFPIRLEPLAQQHWAWVVDKASPLLCEDTQGIVALRGDYLVAAVVLDSWTDNSCLTHIVIEDPQATRRLLRAACHHVFVTADRGVAYGLTPANNEKALRASERIGFVEVCRLKDAYRRGVDFVLQEMRKENCRWLPKKDRLARAA